MSTMSIVEGSPRPIRTDDEGSMAQKTARDRWPKLVQNMIDDVEETGDGGRVVEELNKLKEDIVQNEALTPLDNDGGTDISEYNRSLGELENPTWLSVEWLFSECYLYRRVQAMFAREAKWRGYDVFRRQKDAAFASSGKAVQELVSRFNEVLELGRSDSSIFRGRALFNEMIQISLWGNATDLSLLSTIASAELESKQGISAMEASKANIVDDDSDALWSHMESVSQVDIVLDNAGFEFLTDLILAAYLLKAGLARKVVLHTKAFGWFVSDVTPGDVERTLAALEDKAVFSDRRDLDPFCGMLRELFASKQLQVAPVSSFWTTHLPFSQMPNSDPTLLKALEASSLVIFKGDLNYRKLTADKTWPYTTPFDVALEDLRKSRINILALRTNKADVCVGLENDAQVAELESRNPGSAWVSNGAYAVISFSQR